MQPKSYGGAGHRSPYLSHAKRALYHLSYTPSDDLMLLSSSPDAAENLIHISDFSYSTATPIPYRGTVDLYLSLSWIIFYGTSVTLVKFD